MFGLAGKKIPIILAVAATVTSCKPLGEDGAEQSQVAAVSDGREILGIQNVFIKMPIREGNKTVLRDVQHIRFMICKDRTNFRGRIPEFDNPDHCANAFLNQNGDEAVFLPAWLPTEMGLKASGYGNLALTWGTIGVAAVGTGVLVVKIAVATTAVVAASELFAAAGWLGVLGGVGKFASEGAVIYAVGELVHEGYDGGERWVNKRTRESKPDRELSKLWNEVVADNWQAPTPTSEAEFEKPNKRIADIRHIKQLMEKKFNLRGNIKGLLKLKTAVYDVPSFKGLMDGR